MERRFLVCYASGTGSTREVAEHIGMELKQGGVSVEVRPVDAVNGLNEYDAVVVGSSIRFGRWLPEAVVFLEDSAETLATLPVALFTTCITIVDDSESAQRTALAYWEPVLSLIPAVEPVGLGLFAGSLLPMFEPLTTARGPHGDFRDWDAIGAWAQKIRPALVAGSAQPREPMTLRSSVLSYTDLSGANLSRYDFQESQFVEADLHATKLRESNLRRATLNAADLHEADLSGANLGWANLVDTQCQAADFSDTTMMGTRFDNANLQRANLSRAILNGASLENAQLQGANLRAADLNWANLRGANLSGADLSGAQLGWADLRGANLKDALLTNTRYNDETQWPDGFELGNAGCISFEYMVG